MEEKEQRSHLPRKRAGSFLLRLLFPLNELCSVQGFVQFYKSILQYFAFVFPIFLSSITLCLFVYNYEVCMVYFICSAYSVADP